MIKGPIASLSRTRAGVGLLIYSEQTDRHLFLLRNDPKNITWALPGGKIERSETLRDCLIRECREEIDWDCQSVKLFPLERYTSDDERFIYHTFYTVINHEFIPKLNDEHRGYCWIDSDMLPKPLHRGLFNTLNYDVIQQKIVMIREALKIDKL